MFTYQVNILIEINRFASCKQGIPPISSIQRHIVYGNISHHRKAKNSRESLENTKSEALAIDRLPIIKTRVLTVYHWRWEEVTTMKIKHKNI